MSVPTLISSTNSTNIYALPPNSGTRISLERGVQYTFHVEYGVDMCEHSGSIPVPNNGSLESTEIKEMRFSSDNFWIALHSDGPFSMMDFGDNISQCL